MRLKNVERELFKSLYYDPVERRASSTGPEKRNAKNMKMLCADPQSTRCKNQLLNRARAPRPGYNKLRTAAAVSHGV
jgi:hypothetical protein